MVVSDSFLWSFFNFSLPPFNKGWGLEFYFVWQPLWTALPCIFAVALGSLGLALIVIFEKKIYYLNFKSYQLDNLPKYSQICHFLFRCSTKALMAKDQSTPPWHILQFFSSREKACRCQTSQQITLRVHAAPASFKDDTSKIAFHSLWFDI